MNFHVDIRSVLPAISAPTLVVHRTGDYIVPVECGRYTAEHIRGSSLVELPGDFHLTRVPGAEDDAMDAVEQFLTGSRGQHDVDRVLTTVLFTDIVGSTERASLLGDHAWRELLDLHDQVVRREIEQFKGREIKTLGDGFLAAFDDPGRAVRCRGPSPRKPVESGLRFAAASTAESVRSGEATWPVSRSTSVPA